MKTTQNNALVRGRGIGAPVHDGPHTMEAGRGLRQITDVDTGRDHCYYCDGEPHRLDIDLFDCGGIPVNKMDVCNYTMVTLAELYRLKSCGMGRWPARWQDAHKGKGGFRTGHRLCYDGWVIPESIIQTEMEITMTIAEDLNNFRESITVSDMEWWEQAHLELLKTPARPLQMKSPQVRDEDEEGHQEDRNVRRKLDMEPVIEVQCSCPDPKCHNKWD